MVCKILFEKKNKKKNAELDSRHYTYAGYAQFCSVGILPLNPMSARTSPISILSIKVWGFLKSIPAKDYVHTFETALLR